MLKTQSHFIDIAIFGGGYSMLCTDSGLAILCDSVKAIAIAAIVRAMEPGATVAIVPCTDISSAKTRAKDIVDNMAQICPSSTVHITAQTQETQNDSGF